MDSHYDWKSAREVVEALAATRMKMGNVLLSSDSSEKIELCPDKYIVAPVARPRSWKFAELEDGGDGCDEIILHLQGILCSKNLPPFSMQRKIDPKKRKFMRQSLSLTSFGGPTLTKAIKTIHEIQHFMSRTFPAQTMDDWMQGEYQDYPAIDTANRYFTDRHDMGSVGQIDIPENVDPKGDLTKLMGEEYVHLPENEVTYFEIIKQDGKDSYRVMDPIRFRAGDIVEAQVTFCAVPIKGERYRMLVTLRSIMLLDSEPLRQANAAKMQLKSKIPRTLTIKRKMAYGADDEDETTAKVARMVM